MLRIVVLMILAAGAVAQPTSTKWKPVQKADYGEKWPFVSRVGRGEIGCQAKATWFRANGVTYAINGHALGRKIGKDPDPILADVRLAKGITVKADLSPLRSDALKLCT